MCLASDIYKPAKENYKQNYNINVLDDICDIEPSVLNHMIFYVLGFLVSRSHKQDITKDLRQELCFHK